MSLIVLAAVQYSVNQNYSTDNIQYQGVLTRAVTNQELMSELTLLTRVYMDVNIGLEPDNSDYAGSRTALIKNLSLNYIETVRLNLQ